MMLLFSGLHVVYVTISTVVVVVVVGTITRIPIMT